MTDHEQINIRIIKHECEIVSAAFVDSDGKRPPRERFDADPNTVDGVLSEVTERHAWEEMGQLALELVEFIGVVEVDET